jgi:hypothetical protein
VLAILASYGPWSAFSISEASQRGRLEEYLKTNGIFENDQLQPVSAAVTLEDRLEMSSIVRYLDEWHGPEAFSRWFDDSSLQAWSKINTYGAVPDSVASHMGFQLTSRWQAMSLAGEFNFSTWGIHENPIALAGFDYLYRFNFNNVTDTIYAFPFKDDSCYVRIFPDQAMLTAKVGTNRGDNVRGVSVDLRPRFDSLSEDMGNYRLRPEQLAFDASSDLLRVRFLIESISGKKTDSSYTVEGMSARLLVGRK